MTQDEFVEVEWTAGMLATYQEHEYSIVSVHFRERLIAFDFYGDGDLTWVRCENVSNIKCK
ncbi:MULTISPECIES: hypothetical protein [unclassified Methylophaga]|jgi:hypothetical protein|uniref:hypothetical protein n=1 Tax=unclassified Methylophaga TaxID=2629249 RepID=UPI00259CA4A6|nr:MULTISPECIES: hypothetical protein [unclassified Methylophaga]|tara:strand:+ start:40484 stop:40666 length:183 start_codon:yes stop_codon:yes gene_type:complete